MEPAEALWLARNQPRKNHVPTRRAEHPFWIVLPLAQAAPAETVVELPSRHVQSFTCWNADTLDVIGSGDRRGTAGVAAFSKGGFRLNLGALPASPDTLLCRLRHSGPASIYASAATPGTHTQEEHGYHHGAGLLEGGLLTLAVFTLVMAITNREPRYLLLTVWLILNLRMGGLSAGWDTQWLGHTIPPEWMNPVRKLTIAFYYLVAYALFGQLFRNDIARAGFLWLLRAGQLSALLLLVPTLALPYADFLPLMWTTVIIGIGIMVFLLVYVLIGTRSRTALWYSAALALVFFASFSEVIAAAFDFKLLLSTFNSVTAALASSGLVVLALAEQVRSEKRERLRVQEELRRTYESTPVGLFTLDTEGHFLRTNTTMQTMLGLRSRPSAEDHWQKHFEAGAWATLRRIAAHPGGGEAEVRGLPTDDGSAPWFLVRAVEVRDWIEGSLQDITDRVQATERLRYLANHDSLTGALNRRRIEDMLATSVAEAAQERPLIVAYLDLDRFKLVNELHRNQAGDEVLKEVTLRIQAILGRDHWLGRLGGDEFLVIMRDTSIIAAARIGVRILEAVNGTPFRFGNHSFQIRISAGLIEVIPGMSAAEALSTAELACREAKEGHKERLVIYEHDAAIHSERAEELRLIKALGEPELPEGLYLVAQPILSLRRPSESLNFEILLRMRDDDGNEIPAGKILNAAEAGGNMARLDKWVLTQALEWLQRHQSKLAKTRFVSVNISGVSLNDQAFVQEVPTILEKYQPVIQYLCLEITEGVALRDFQYTREFIGRVKSRGVSVALDDFGAGYTSFTYLRSLQADALKIDGSFVRTMNQHPANVAIIEAIIELARNLGMRSIAEGVEDTTMLETLAELGVDYIQGYVIARPQPLESLLVADSAASYIDDPALAQLVRQLAKERISVDETGSASYH